MKMKIAVYSCRPDERALFDKIAAERGVELAIAETRPTLENADLAEGCQAVSVVTTPVPAELLDRWKTLGVRAVSTRTVGFDHIDCRHAEEIGIAVSNVSYTPHTVAEYTVMTILMALRRMKTIITRYAGQDFSLKDVRGRELRNLTVGVIGTGKIGEMVIEKLSGFGCRVLACAPREKERVKALAPYVDLETVWQEADVITLHAPANEETCHLINRDTLNQMKDGVVIINMARGILIDTDALIEALENGKVGAAALDVVEEEGKIYYHDYKYCPTGNHQMAILQAMPNVLMTPHTAFFTEEAVEDMIRYSIENCVRDSQASERGSR